MPKLRRADETEQDFISRCMSEIKGEFPDSKQRYAVCKSYSNKSEKNMEKEELFILKPKKTENRGMYLTRCSNNSKMKLQFKNLKERMGFCLNSFNEYYSYWAKIEDFAEVPKNTILGDCIAEQKSKGFDYKQAYARCATKVGNKPLGSGQSIVLEEDLLVEPVEFAEMNILGYNTKYFDLCPGAKATFKHLMEMGGDEDTSRMIRNAAVLADRVFEIENEVLKSETATPEILGQATLMVDDFYELMEVIDERLGMEHDVLYMDGHLEKISSFIEK